MNSGIVLLKYELISIHTIPIPRTEYIVLKDTHVRYCVDPSLEPACIAYAIIGHTTSDHNFATSTLLRLPDLVWQDLLVLRLLAIKLSSVGPTPADGCLV
jgi:hypothetical protein